VAGARSGFRALLKRSATAESEAVSSVRNVRSATAESEAVSPGTGVGRGYGAGARILSIGIATTGVVTFAYFSLASHALSDADYSHISLLWAVLFVIVSVIYRPIEQLLSRTIAGRRARGLEHGHPLRTPLIIQAAFAVTFAIVALALKGPITDGLFDGSAALFWVLFFAVLFYAASYFARGWLAGHQWFALYGGLVFMEATSRCLFALAVVLGIAEGQTAVALGMAAAPLVSLVVVPLAFSRRTPAASAPRGGDDDLDLARGGRFALAVFCVMLAEQTLINGAVLTAYATAASTAVAGYVFNVLLIARAPLQLFQAIQGSLLPHLAGLHATEDSAEFHRAIRVTVLAIAGFAGAVALGLLILGPWAMNFLFDDAAEYGRWGLAIVALGMGAHLAAGTLNQAALARDHAHAAALAWIVSAALFVGWMLAPIVDDELVRAEVGYLGAATLLCGLLTLVYRRPR
jgi:O-antigen/teichoic acid export membrane protein